MKQMINLVIKDIYKYISNIILSGNMFGSIDIYDFCVRIIYIENWGIIAVIH